MIYEIMHRGKVEAEYAMILHEREQDLKERLRLVEIQGSMEVCTAFFFDSNTESVSF
jgi:hypothetical protein